MPGDLLRRRQLARARLAVPGQLHAAAALAAGYTALASFPAVLTALVATGSFGAPGFAAVVVVAATIALASAAPVLIFGQVGSRLAWLALLAAQFCWPFAGALLGAAESGRRKQRLSPPAPPRSAASWMAGYGIAADRDLILVSAGSRGSLVVQALQTMTGMRLKEAFALVDKPPGLIMHQVSAGQADRAR